jgi:hypothetical protein
MSYGLDNRSGTFLHFLTNGSFIVEKAINAENKNFIFKPTEMMKLKVVFEKWDRSNL